MFVTDDRQRPDLKIFFSISKKSGKNEFFGRETKNPRERGGENLFNDKNQIIIIRF